MLFIPTDSNRKRDLAIFASRMNRILRIPKRMHEGIKNSEQFERRTSQNCKKINYAHLAMTWHCVPSIIYKTTLMGILKNYQGRYLSLTTRQHLFFEIALDYTIRHTLYVPWLNCNLRWCCDKIDLQFWYWLAIMKILDNYLFEDFRSVDIRTAINIYR